MQRAAVNSLKSLIFYEGEASRASRELHGIVDSSDPLMHSWKA